MGGQIVEVAASQRLSVPEQMRTWAGGRTKILDGFRSVLSAILMQDKNLNIYLAHGDDGQRRVIEANLGLLSHRIELSTASPAVLMRRCEENPPHLAIVGSCFEADDCFDIFNGLSQRRICPVVAILQHRDMDRSQRLIADQVMGVLVEPVNESDLRTAIYLARRRFEQSQAMKRRICELEDELAGLDAAENGEGEAES